MATSFSEEMQALQGNILPVHGWHTGSVFSTDLSPLFGEVLRKYRKTAKISQEALSERADVDVRMIRLVETKGQNLSVNLADSLAYGLNVPLSELLREAEELRRGRSGMK